MQIGSRFTEYGLTGGFFWICQFILLWCSGQIQTLQSNVSTVQLHIAKDIPIPITSLVTALAIIAVFVTGLLLDLFAVYFRPMEIRVFIRHLVRNRDWVGRLIADHKGYCEADYEEFDRRYSGTSLAAGMRAGFDIFLFWNQERRQRWVASAKRGWAWGLARPYERLWSFFASYVVVQSGSSQLSFMVDQYHLWRTGRAVSTALVILFFEIQFFNVSHASEMRVLVFIGLGFLFPLALNVLAIVITLGTYSRLCFTLFALVYVTQDKAQRGI
jgi:hypothetical protein